MHDHINPGTQSLTTVDCDPTPQAFARRHDGASDPPVDRTDGPGLLWWELGFGNR